MAKLYNLARMSTATTGTGTITLGSAISGFLSFAGAGVANGDVVSYGIKDGANSEVGTGTYTSAGTTLTRSVTKSTNSNNPISLSGNAEVYITARAEDISFRLVTQVFTASGTYTPTMGMVSAFIECVGGGGGGGGTAATSSGNTAGAGGGGAGSYARKVASAATVGASQTVTIGAGGTGASAGNNTGGAGGDTGVGSLCIGKGASGGAGAADAGIGAGGNGGVAGTGDFTPVGQPGFAGFGSGTNVIQGIGGTGASGIFGAGAKQVTTVSSATGNAASNYGAGGGGGASYNGAGAAAGGNGSAGVVVITELVSQ